MNDTWYSVSFSKTKSQLNYNQTTKTNQDSLTVFFDNLGHCTFGLDNTKMTKTHKHRSSGNSLYLPTSINTH